MPGPSKIVQFQSMPDGSLVALDSNGNLWQGRIDTGYYSVQSAHNQAGLYGSSGQLNISQAKVYSAGQAQQVFMPGTGKVKWTKISE